MKFFIPELEGFQQTREDLYQAIKKFVARWGPIEGRRIYSMMFWDRVDKKKPVKATVGRSDPLLIPRVDVTEVEYFER